MSSGNWAVNCDVLFKQATHDQNHSIRVCFIATSRFCSSGIASEARLPTREPPYGILKVKTADDEDSWIRSRWREDHGNADGNADWYDGRQDDRAEALKQYSYRPPSDDSDCFT